MSDTATPTLSQRIGALQAEFTEALGADVVRALHRDHPGRDAAATVVPPLALLAGFIALGRADLPWPAVVVLVTLNGWLFTIIGLVAHDVSVHRMRWGRTGSWLHNAFAWGLMLMPGTAYAKAHTRHHAKLGTPDDTEAYKMELNTRLRRWTFLTFPGVLYMTRRKMPGQVRGYMIIEGDDETARRFRLEKKAVLVLVGALVAYSVWVNPRSVLLGYLLPLFVVSPLFNTMRIVLEHAEADDATRYWLGTNYRCGWLARAVFLADSGDCHIVHHIFPRIPFYHCGRAAALIRPYVTERGVVERRAYWPLVTGWLLRNHAHRSRWPADAAARRGPRASD